MPGEGDRLVFVSTSKVLAETAWADGSNNGAYMTEKANLYILASPGEMVEQYVEYGNDLAASGLLAGYTTAEFSDRAEELREQVAGIDTLKVVAQHEGGIVQVDIVLKSFGTR